MTLSRTDVAGIARYAHIELTSAELDEMSTYLNDAVALLEPLLAYDLDDVEPTFHPIGGLSNVIRSDSAASGLAREEALANAGSTREGCFRVPAILPDGGEA